MCRRAEILNGTLTFPKQIMEIVNPTANIELDSKIRMFWDNIWHNYLREKSVDTLTWYTTIANKDIFNKVLLHLSKAGWITSTVDNLYAFITLNGSKLEKWVTKEELTEVRRKYKFMKYRLTKTKSKLARLVQINGKHKPTGLVREGFKKAGNNVFKFDTRYLKKYLEPIAANTKKGLVGSTKDVTYQEVIDELTEYYSKKEHEYTLGNCVIDSRGRSIFNCTKKIFNPVASKDARALLVVPARMLDLDGWNYIFAYIAELWDYRGKNFTDKVLYGESMYECKKLPSLNEMVEAQDYSNLHKLIWLERIYENIDNYQEYGWYVPVDSDATASMIQIIGVLLNNRDYMRGTNLIKGDEFKDIWTVDYCSREHVKKALTPMLYGSSKSPKELWDSNKLEYTQVQLNKIMKDVQVGIYSAATKFKDFILENVKPQEVMKIKVFDEVFIVECNKFKWEHMSRLNYWVYTSAQGIVKRASKQTQLTADLEQFKRFFVTCLIHNLDSQIADTICKEVDWVLPNHDSFISHPNDCYQVRKTYITCMFHIYQNRKEILKDYFQSIGIDKEYVEKEQAEVTEFSLNCLK